MKIKTLTTLALISSFAVPAYSLDKDVEILSCGTNQSPVGAAVAKSENGLVGRLSDNYIAAMQLSCATYQSDIICSGDWNYDGEVAEVKFSANEEGIYTATFKRPEYYGGNVVTLACVLLE